MNRLFGRYIFADYSGAAAERTQIKAIKVADATGDAPARIVPLPFTRELLVEWMHTKLLSASQTGVRLCFGQDHSYGFPLGLANQLGIGNLPWRSAMTSLLNGEYATDAPHFFGVPNFTRDLNSWLRSRGFEDYFWSATKKSYGLLPCDPRGKEKTAFSRMTDRRRSIFGHRLPMPFSRVGDNGSVGGQSLWGMSMLRKLLSLCERDGIAVRCWPFDGLTLSDHAYANAHVLVEAYPSALRSVNPMRLTPCARLKRFNQQIRRDGLKNLWISAPFRRICIWQCDLKAGFSASKLAFNRVRPCRGRGFFHKPL